MFAPFAAMSMRVTNCPRILNARCAEELLRGTMQDSIRRLYNENCDYIAMPELETNYIPDDREW